MYALVDAVAFYASCEKVFDPSIRNKPVVVLTNNDGCICAVCPIARRLGIPKFKPYFQMRSFLAKHNVVVRSSNYELYADLSERMMNVIARFCDNHYVYSIDESFLHFDNYHNYIKDWHDYGHKIRRAVWKETKLPVGVGFGISPTLSKAANHAAKKIIGF
jgi:DNA polymerase V